jgi:drug/metabolite transporter (DMT)-like permease
MTQTAVGTLLAVFCAILEGFGQLFLKKSMLTAVRWPLWASLGVAVFCLEAVAYTKALVYLDVSEAYALGSLNLIAVAILSQWFLQEKVTKVRWLGVCLIFIGVGLVMARR